VQQKSVARFPSEGKESLRSDVRFYGMLKNPKSMKIYTLYAELKAISLEISPASILRVSAGNFHSCGG
jgi:hypothetical protein